MDAHRFTLDELMDGVAKVLTPRARDNFYTPTEWAQIWQCSVERSRKSIGALVEAGKMERDITTMVSPLNGRVCKIYVFGLKEQHEE